MKYVQVVFSDNSIKSKQYTYRCMWDDAQVGQYAVVKSPWGYKVVEIVSVSAAPRTVLDTTIEFKHLVALLDVRSYEAFVAQQLEAKRRMNELESIAEAKAKIKSTRELLGKKLGAEYEALQAYFKGE